MSHHSFITKGHVYKPHDLQNSGTDFRAASSMVTVTVSGRVTWDFTLSRPIQHCVRNTTDKVGLSHTQSAWLPLCVRGYTSPWYSQHSSSKANSRAFMWTSQVYTYLCRSGFINTTSMFTKGTSLSKRVIGSHLL